MIFLIINWPNFMYLLLISFLPLPLKFLWSIAVCSPIARMDDPERHNRDKRTNGQTKRRVSLSVRLCLRWSLTHSKDLDPCHSSIFQSPDSFRWSDLCVIGLCLTIDKSGGWNKMCNYISRGQNYICVTCVITRNHYIQRGNHHTCPRIRVYIQSNNWKQDYL